MVNSNDDDWAIRTVSNQWFILPSHLHFDLFSSPFDFVEGLLSTHFDFKFISKEPRFLFLWFHLELIPVRFFFRLLENQIIIEIVFPKSVCSEITLIDIIVKFWKILSKITKCVCLEVIGLEVYCFIIWRGRGFHLRGWKIKDISLFRSRLMRLLLRLIWGGCWKRVKIEISKFIGVGWLRISILSDTSKICKRIVLIFLFLSGFTALVLMILYIFKTLIIDSHLKLVNEVRDSCDPKTMTLDDMSIIKVNVENA